MLKKSKQYILLVMILLLMVLTTACSAAKKDGRIVRGAADAPVTIIEYTDFQMSLLCQRRPDGSAIMAKYEGKVNLVVNTTHCRFTKRLCRLPSILRQ